MGNEYYMSCEGAGAGDGDGEDFGDLVAPEIEGRQAISPEGVAVGGTPIGGEQGTPAPGTPTETGILETPWQGSTGPGIITFTGGDGVEAIKKEEKPVVPIVPEVTPEVTKEKEEVKAEAVKGVPKAKKRQRRPTILTGEEGLMYTAPGKRRSLLGG